MEWNHDNATVVLMSNSGKTHEVLETIRALKDKGHKDIFAVTAIEDSPLTELCGRDNTYVLSCGAETAIAATKSVVEQALFLQHAILQNVTQEALDAVANHISDIFNAQQRVVLNTNIANMVKTLKNVHIVGATNGVAPELALKTPEITGLFGASYPNTSIVHGYQEPLTKEEDLVLLIDPKTEHLSKFKESLVTGTKTIEAPDLNVLAISNAPSKKTSFPTYTIPKMDDFDAYFELAAGWQMLLSIAEQQGADPDEAKRATKVGFEDTPKI